MNPRFSVFLCTVLCFAPAAQPALAEDECRVVSQAVGSVLSVAEADMKAGDLAAALDKIHQAQGIPSRSTYDEYVTNDFLANAAIGQKDYETATDAYEAMADSSCLATNPGKAIILSNALLLSVEMKHYAKAVRYGTALSAIQPLSDIAAANLALAYYSMHDLGRARALAQQSIATATSEGRAPNDVALHVLTLLNQ